MDTATAATTVAVVGPGVREERTVVDGRRHAETIAPLLHEVLDGRIDLVACGVGPGPFTGLRVGIATALAFGAARGVPVIGVCSLDVIARAAVRKRAEPVTVLTRARRAELCWASYDAAGIRTAGPMIHREPLEIDGLCVGDAVGTLMYPAAIDLADLVLDRLAEGEELPTDLDLPEEDAAASGASVAEILGARLAGGSHLLPPRPIYLRRPDAVVPAQVTP